jgi:hypothetical protein
MFRESPHSHALAFSGKTDCVERRMRRAGRSAAGGIFDGPMTAVTDFGRWRVPPTLCGVLATLSEMWY